MYNNNYNYNKYSLPRQRVPEAEKTDDWKIENVRSVIGMSAAHAQDAWRSSKQEKQVNYDLLNGQMDTRDFEKVTDPLGIGKKYGGQPADMEMYNITKSKIELLKGEEGARPFNWMVRGVGGNIVTIKEEERRKMVVAMLQQSILSQMGLNPNASPEEQQTPAQIQKYMDTEFMDSREVTANQILNFLVKRDHIARKFNEGWEHALIVAEEIYYVGIKDGHPSVRVVNPISFSYDKDSDEKFIEDAEWASEERWLHASSILDLYDDDLEDDDKERILNGDFMSSYNAGMQTGFAYQEGASPEMRSFLNQPQNGILVTHVAWRGWKEVYFLTDFDPETGQFITTVIPSSIKLTSEQKARGASLERKWKKQIWVGTMIGADIFVDVRPSDVQDGKLPYAGYIYSSTNSKATSLMDHMKQHQYSYNIVWWRLMTELAKNKGKKMPMDVAMIPKSWGMDMDQWIYYEDRLDIIFYNSLEEGPRGQKPSQAAFTSVDMQMSQTIAQHILILEKLEKQIAMLTGVSPQRESQVMASESATGVNTAVVQSSYITEPLFRYHNEVKKQVLTKLLSVSKVAYKDGKKIQYVVDEAYVSTINIDGDEYSDSDYGLHVSDSSKDYQTKQKLESLAQIALQQDKATLRDMVKLYNANSIAEFEHYLIQAEDKKLAQMQEMDKAKMENDKAIAEAQIAAQKDIADREDARNADNNKTKIKVEEMKLRNQDLDKNGVPDILEQTKATAVLMKTQLDAAAKDKQAQIDSKKNNEDTFIKEDANRIKEKDVDLKHKDAQADRSHEKKMAEKEEQMMDKEDKLKDKEFNRTIKLDNHKVQHEEKLGNTKLKVAEKTLKVDEKKLTMKMKANKDKVQTAKAMPKPAMKSKTKSK